MKKKFLSLAMSFVMACGMLILPDYSAYNVEAGTISGTCEYYNTSNVGYNAYSLWSKVVNSYLTKTTDGNLMRVQYIGESKILVQYYDSEYKTVDKKEITLDYPIFGGFHATDDAYFVVTGQENLEESDSKEVYRITKYDKDWKRIASCGLYGANTVIPFDAGSLRMVDNGENLLIRTCHEMYKSSDGYNHQANVTIQVNMNTMQVTDSFTGVANIGIGYVSHSFNQFIKLDNNKIVAVDHGDAYPRSICLIKYPTDVSTGHFFDPEYYFGNACESVDVLTFPGNIGQNYTGGSVGGLEISDTKYLVAGNYTYEFGVSGSPRNIFLAAVDKITGEVDLKYITNAEVGDDGNSTPQLVDMQNGYFLMLWTSSGSNEGKVFYAKFDSNGQQVGDIYSMEGNLSDCQPIVCGNKVTWYTNNYDTDTFYEIDTNDVAINSSNVIINGHEYDDYVVENGVMTATCKKCGETTTKTVITDLQILWGALEQDNLVSYYFNIPKIKPGESLYYYVNNATQTPVDEKEIVVEVIEDNISTITDSDYAGTIYGHVYFPEEGTYHIAIYPKLNPSIKKIFEVKVSNESDDENQDGSDVNPGEEIPGGSDVNPGEEEPGGSDVNPGEEIPGGSDVNPGEEIPGGSDVNPEDENPGENNSNSDGNTVIIDSKVDGDVTCDGKVDLNDAKAALKLALGIGVYVSEQGKINADYDKSGKIDLNDAKYILKDALGIKVK